MKVVMVALLSILILGCCSKQVKTEAPARAAAPAGNLK